MIYELFWKICTFVVDMAIFVAIGFCYHFIQLLIGHFLSKSEHNVSKLFDRNKAIVILVENSKEKESLLWNIPLLKKNLLLTFCVIFILALLPSFSHCLGMSYYVNFLGGLDSNEFHIKWIFGTHGSWKKSKYWGPFGATS